MKHHIHQQMYNHEKCDTWWVHLWILTKKLFKIMSMSLMFWIKIPVVIFPSSRLAFKSNSFSRSSIPSPQEQLYIGWVGRFSVLLKIHVKFTAESNKKLCEKHTSIYMIEFNVQISNTHYLLLTNIPRDYQWMIPILDTEHELYLLYCECICFFQILCHYEDFVM